MALRLLPFRSYSDHDVINMFANDTTDSDQFTNGNGSQGVFVKVSAGDLTKDFVEMVSATYLGKVNYPHVGADLYPAVPLKVTAATATAPVLGITLAQTLTNDENGSKILYNPIKKAELQACVSGQAVPIAVRGIFTLSDSAIDWVDANMGPGAVLKISANAGKVTGVALTSVTGLTTAKMIVGHVLATGQRVSQTGDSDQFAGTTTGKYAICSISCGIPVA
jgi:hypothetical protein